MKDYGCRYKLPHDYKPLKENTRWKLEICVLCNKKVKWNKGKLERIDNNEYLKAHIRNFCQKWGRTKEIYHKLYRREQTIIKL